jgi:methyl-accepting chemotaxis protein
MGEGESMTIGKKIAGGFGLALAFLALIGFLSYRSTEALLEANAKVIHTYKVVEYLNAVMLLMVDHETGQRGFLITGDEKFLKPYLEAPNKLKEAFGELVTSTHDNDAQQRRLKDLEERIKVRLKYTEGVVEIGQSKEKGKGLEAAKEIVKTGVGKKLMDDVREKIKETVDEEKRLLDERQKVARSNAEFTTYTVGTSAALAFLCVGLVGFGIVRSITSTIHEGVGQLTSASAEILASTSQQATGAQEQAAAVTQTMTTVDEVTQTAEQSAQRARSVGESVQRTLEIGKAGRKVVEESLVAMESVKDKVETTAQNIMTLAEQAQAISDIIATVNDIAEQTNLLALNAAIEASRAGEHGRGFTVVAGEVKMLADQSKKATGQVRQILGEIQKATNTAVLSTEEVTKGVASAIKVAGQAGDTIKTLADTLTDTSQAVKQIAASVGQQATGMSQINQAMKNIDQVAKQNTSATRQAAQAAQNLNNLGLQLATLIGK